MCFRWPAVPLTDYTERRQLERRCCNYGSELSPFNAWSMWKTLLLIASILATGIADDCVPRSFGTDKIVCVCNATYCDSVVDNDQKIRKDGSFSWYVSSMDGRRMSKSNARFGSQQEKNPTADETLTVDPTKKYQTIFGFGGAFTDSAGINIKKLSPPTQEQLIKTYYDPIVGSKYSFGRVPAGGTDFSTRPYTYDDVENDVKLGNFSLAKEDYDYKIPFMKLARKMNPETRFFSASWSAPPWMKTNNKINGFGFLKKECYQLYADYLVKFLDAYKSNGLDIWAISTGNEPMDALVLGARLNSMGWTPGTVAEWIANNLGPTLAKSAHDTMILAHDDQRIELPWYIDAMFQNKKAENFTSGIAVHWYTDSFAPASLVNTTHEHFPDKFILMTEACTGSNLFEFPKVDLGSWSRGEKYMLSIIEYLNNWSVGWVDWNLVLDKDGGPNWIENNVDSAIITNPETDEFYKQPMFYAIQHFSKFIGRGSVRISINNSILIKATAVLTPSNEVVVVLYNKSASPKNIVLKDTKKGSMYVQVPPHSMNTIIYAQ